MPRIRTVKPELASDKKLATVSRDARYTFVLLISQADDDGLVRAEPRQLLGNLYPHDHDVSWDILEAWLAELVGNGVVRWRQTKDGMRVLELVNWGRHQKIVNRSKPFLLNQLVPQNETLNSPSVEPQEEIVRPSVDSRGAESRVLSPESRVQSPKNPLASHAARNGNRSKPTWLSPFATLWTAGTPPYGQLAKALKPLVAEHGTDEVLRRWGRYLKARDPTYWSPQKFGQTFNTWNADVPISGITDEPDLEWVDQSG